MRAVAYARVSSKVQRDRQTIENQLRALPDFIERQGWELVRPAATYVDDGKSAKAGRLAHRDGLSRLMVDAVAGVFDVVAVVDLDRLTRSEDIAERGQVIGAFQRAGVKIALASSGQVLDLGSSMGDLFSGLQGFFAAEENRKRRERTVAGKLRAIAEGRKPAGPTPFGYRYDRQAGWSLHDENAELVREIFRRVAGGESCHRIAEDLIDRGIARPRGGAWHYERVWQIVTARTYLGEWTADKDRGLTIPVPRIIEESTWVEAQRTLTRNRKRGLSRAKHVYLLDSGVAECGWCEARIGVSTGSAQSTGRHRHTYYVCSHRRRPPRQGDRCLLPMAQVASVDERVWSGVVGYLGRRDLLEVVLERHASQAQRGRRDWGKALADAEGKLGRLARTEAAMLARFRRGSISEAAMDLELAAQSKERRELERDAEAARRAGGAVASGDVRVLSSTLKGMQRRLGMATAVERRKLVAALLGDRRLSVTPEAITGTLGLEAGMLTGLHHTAGSSPEHVTSHGLVLEFRLVA